MLLVSVRFAVAAGIILLGSMLAPQETFSASAHVAKLNVQEQTTCEEEMLATSGGREVVRGKVYNVLIQVAGRYGRATPHIYTVPGSMNMAYIGASVAVDGRGKILVGQQAAELFGPTALKGFFAHEMAHLVSDNETLGCNDYIVRNPQANDRKASCRGILGAGIGTNKRPELGREAPAQSIASLQLNSCSFGLISTKRWSGTFVHQGP